MKGGVYNSNREMYKNPYFLLRSDGAKGVGSLFRRLFEKGNGIFGQEGASKRVHTRIYRAQGRADPADCKCIGSFAKARKAFKPLHIRKNRDRQNINNKVHCRKNKGNCSKGKRSHKDFLCKLQAEKGCRYGIPAYSAAFKRVREGNTQHGLADR